MLFHTFKSLVIALALGVGTASAQDASNSLVTRRFTEYVMPAAKQTHEFARVPNTNMVLLSQWYDSRLVKIELDATTEEPIAYESFPMGKNSASELHGVWPSKLYPGKMWLTLQAENQLLLVDPGTDISTPPTIIKTIDIPAPGNGPHCIFEIGNRVWAGLKVASKQTRKFYVFSADIENPKDQKLYPCLESPVFISEEPTSGLIYVTQDTASAIMQINVTNGRTRQLRIPRNFGHTPVGMITAHGSLSGVWFTLAGGPRGGTGTFGHIGADGRMKFFKVPQLGANAGLLHLADASNDAGPALWLLSTSLLNPNGRDALIRVTFDDAIKSITGEEHIALPSQNAKAHRIMVLENSVMVSELNTFTIAQLTYKNTVAGKWPPAQSTH